MTALDAVADWPVASAAAVVTGADEILATTGPVDEPYPWASVTKLITALAVLTAVGLREFGPSRRSTPGLRTAGRNQP